ncbi:MAG TPA: ATP-dependent zinc metalloprotease FtsH [Solirubrobacterales bacterium]|nr:ATP-dependent zinc metalloprotease FtsH [Solirubrobacterales bacterium]
MSNPRLTSTKKQNSVGDRIAGLIGPVWRFLRKDLLSTGLLLASAVLLILFFSLLGSLGPEGSGEGVPLSTVTKLAEDNQIVSAELLDYDHQIVVETSSGLQQTADYPGSDAATQQLLNKLTKAGAEVTVNPQSGKETRIIVVQFLLPILILVCLFSFFMRQAAGAEAGGIGAFSAFGGKGKRRKKGQKAPITFESVAGAGEALAELKEIRDFLEDPSKYNQMGAAAPKGVLLVGPPGTGKTLLARATAGEADAAFFTASGAEFVESLVGVGAARIRDLFAKARKQAPAIIFIDELDAAGRKRGAGVGQGNDEREQTLNQLLVEMDGFGGDAGVCVMGATNRPDILDPALLRPGRFDRQVVVDVPDVHGRFEILELHAKGRQFAPDVDLNEIAKLCPGFSGAELANLVNEAALLTVREGRPDIDQPTLEEAIDRVVAGPAKKSHVLTESERWTIAIHEAGHAVATRAIGQVVSAQKLSIVARGRQLGTAAHMLTDRDAVMHAQSDLERQLVAILSGTAAEWIEFGEGSTGASDDLHAATKLARQMVTSFGMSPALGAVTIGEAGGEVFLGASLQDMGSVGPATLDTIDEETERIVEEAKARATFVLTRNWSVVGETARALLDQETLSGMALEALLSPVTEISVDEIAPPDRSPDIDREV